MGAEREEITPEEADALFADARKNTMTEADKVRFREERASFAEGGGLEDDSEPKPISVSLLSPKDIPEIEAAVHTKIIQLMAQRSNGGVDPAEVSRVFSVVSTLRSKGLIGDQVYGEAESFFGLSEPISERRRD